ncbi:hypothetical protein [Pontiella sp.]|uniref:hypothetical protein n=1 Tax=Pontiella sp. TaxID=2837462 RepID=UPI003563009E
MNLRLLGFLAGFAFSASGGFAAPVEYDFNGFADGPIDGQQGWDVYNKVQDSSAMSIMDEVGAQGVPGDKALVLQTSETAIRCVSGEPVRWLPGTTLTAEFDFKLGVDAAYPTRNMPIMEFVFGNSFLSEKARWSIVLEAMPGGDWNLTSSMPGSAPVRIYGENLLVRPASDVALSEWFVFKLVVKKLSTPAAFETRAQICDTKGKVLATLAFATEGKDKVTQSMWSLPRVHAGFHVHREIQGLAVVDNLRFSSAN